MQTSTTSATARQLPSREQIAATCARCGGQFAARPAQARHALDCCPKCGERERLRLAQRARRARDKDPNAADLIREIITRYGGSLVTRDYAGDPIVVEEVLPLAQRHGRGPTYLADLLVGFADCGWVVIGLPDDIGSNDLTNSVIGSGAAGPGVIGSGMAGPGVIGSGERVDGGGQDDLLDVDALVALRRQDPARFEVELAKHLRRPTAGTPRALDTKQKRTRKALYPRSRGEPVGHRAAVLLAEERLPPVLDDSRDGGVVLWFVTLTVPDVQRARIDSAGRAWADRMMAEGARGVLLAKDIGDKTGSPHWHGLVLRADASSMVPAWLALSYADAKHQKVEPVTAWIAFRERGNLDARDGNRDGTFKENLCAVVDYMFKVLPDEYGARDLDRNVLASGVFSPVWADVRGAEPPRGEAPGPSSGDLPPRIRPGARLYELGPHSASCATSSPVE